MAKQSKGAQWEREICKTLSLWWTNGERSDIFWRSSQSGGRATQRAKKGLQTAGSYGDICALDPIGKPLLDLVAFELKRGYNKHTFQDILDKEDNAAKQIWEQWIEQVVSSSNNAKTPYWALLVKRDRRKPIVCCLDSFIGRRELYPKIDLRIDDYSLIITTLDAFLHYITPEVINKIKEGFDENS